MSKQSQSSKRQVKPQHITNLRYPYAKTWDKMSTYVEFEIANIHFSMTNAIRRIILSSVKTVGFRTEPYKASQVNILVNDTPLHNQIIAHRIGMIPINIAKPDDFDVDDYLFIINISNDTNTSRSITTEDMTIKKISTNQFLSKNEVKKFFPPDPLTGDYILITKLQPKYFIPSSQHSREVIDEMSTTFSKKVDDVMQFHVEAKACISNGAENGRFSPVACATYINTVDPARAMDGLKAYIDKQIETAKISNYTPMTPEQMSRRFELTEKARFFYVNEKEDPNVFTFKVESVGVIPPLVIFHRAIDILKGKLTNFVANIVGKNENEVIVAVSKNLDGGYEITVKNEDDTLGNLIQSHLCLMYADYTIPKEQRLLKYIGYKKPHPLEPHIIFQIQGLNDNLDELITNVIKIGCGEIVKLLNKIQNELEATPAFISELKAI
jgi:DNA-directed RNA polymerase II subunit RPB3